MTATQEPTTSEPTTWPPGLPRSLDYPPVPVGSVLRAAVRRWGDRTAFVHHDVELTFTELGRRAHAVAAGLAERGIGRGDVVAVHLPNCLQYPAVYYGVLLAGAVFSPTNPLLPPAGLAHQLADAGARALVTWEPVLPVVRAALEAHRRADRRGHRSRSRSPTRPRRSTSRGCPARCPSPTCWPPTTATRTGTPTSTRPPTWPTWPTPGAPPA